MNKRINDYFLKEVVGEGEYGKVYFSSHQISKEKFAIKIIPKEKFREYPRLQILIENEAKAMMMLCSPYIIRFIEMFFQNDNAYLVYEYCEGGNLHQVLQVHNFFSEENAVKYFKQMLAAFKEITSKGIVHRDLKPHNIMFKNDKIKIGDFGFCKILSNSDELVLTMLGSPMYMAPEVLKGHQYNNKADLWSLGVVFHEMLFGFCPFDGLSIASQIALIEENEFTIPSQPITTKRIQNILKRILNKDVNKRIEWKELLNLMLTEEELLQEDHLELTQRNMRLRKSIDNLKAFSPSDKLGKVKGEGIIQDVSKRIEEISTLKSSFRDRLASESHVPKFVNSFQMDISKFKRKNSIDKQQIYNVNEGFKGFNTEVENFVSPKIIEILKKNSLSNEHLKPFAKKKSIPNQVTDSHKSSFINSGFEPFFPINSCFKIAPLHATNQEGIMVELLYLRKRIVFSMKLVHLLIEHKDQIEFQKSDKMISFLLSVIRNSLNSLIDDLNSHKSTLLSEFYEKVLLKESVDFKRFLQNLKQELELLKPLLKEFEHRETLSKSELIEIIDELFQHSKAINLSLFYQKAQNTILILNHFLDFILIEDFFSKTINKHISFENQPYFISLKSQSYLQIVNLVEVKRKYVKKILL